MTATPPKILRLPVLLCLATLPLACRQPPPQEPPPARVPVSVHEVEAAPFRPSVRLLGRVEPAARIELRADVAGTVAYPQRFAGGLRTGETVRAGELVFRVDSPEVQLAVVEAELQSEAAEAEVERSRQGVEGGFVSTATHKKNEIQARIARERLANARAARTATRESSPGGRRVAGGGTAAGRLARRPVATHGGGSGGRQPAGRSLGIGR